MRGLQQVIDDVIRPTARCTRKGSARQHQNACAAGHSRSRQICFEITHQVRGVEIDTEIVARLKEQSCRRFPASTMVFRAVRANQERFDATATLCDRARQTRVDRFDFLLGNDPPADGGLVSGYEDPVALLVQQAQRVKGAGNQFDFRPALHVVGPVTNDDSIPVEEYRRLERSPRGAGHAYPATPTAPRARMRS